MFSQARLQSIYSKIMSIPLNSIRPPQLPSTFKGGSFPSPQGAIHIQIGGRGPAVVLLHGYVQTGDMWGPIASELAQDHTVLVPDLRGIGRSWRSTDGYDKKTQAQDLAVILTGLGFEEVSLVGHDLGGMVAYALASLYPRRVSRLVIMEAVPPGFPGWQAITTLPGTWHFNFRGADAERLVAGRERIYFDRFWNEFAARPQSIGETIRDHYAAQYAAEGAMRAGFRQFEAFEHDAKDAAEFARTKLTMPILALGGEHADKCFGLATAAAMREVAVDVQEEIISNAGHWLVEESPDVVMGLVCNFLRKRKSGTE
jgi:pimeloyl-ACP methyl ester carboxylesterase